MQYRENMSTIISTIYTNSSEKSACTKLLIWTTTIQQTFGYLLRSVWQSGELFSWHGSAPAHSCHT